MNPFVVRQPVSKKERERARLAKIFLIKFMFQIIQIPFPGIADLLSLFSLLGDGGKQLKCTILKKNKTKENLISTSQH